MGAVGVFPDTFPVCGPLDPERANGCDGLDRIVPTGPDVSSNVDGSIQVGEFASASTWVKNGDDVRHDDVCVGVMVDTPGITLTPAEETNPTRMGQMAAGLTFIVDPAYFHVRDVEPGTVARFKFWVTYFGTACVGPTATVAARVDPYP